MKNLNFLLLISACLWACTPNPDTTLDENVIQNGNINQERFDNASDRSGTPTTTVTLSQAEDWADAWRDNTENGIDSSLWSEISFNGFYVPLESIEGLLDISGVDGARIYMGIKAGVDGDNDTATVVLVGVDSSGNDMTADYILDYTRPCPPFCGQQNVLNSDQ